MSIEEARERIDAIIIKHEVDNEPITINSEEDYEALRVVYKALEAIPKIREELSDLLATDNELFGISDALRVIDKYIPKE